MHVSLGVQKEGTVPAGQDSLCSHPSVDLASSSAKWGQPTLLNTDRRSSQIGCTAMRRQSLKLPKAGGELVTSRKTGCYALCSHYLGLCPCPPQACGLLKGKAWALVSSVFPEPSLIIWRDSMYKGRH